MGRYCLLRSVFSGVSDPSQVAAGRQQKNQSNFIKVSQHKKSKRTGEWEEEQREQKPLHLTTGPRQWLRSSFLSPGSPPSPALCLSWKFNFEYAEKRTSKNAKIFDVSSLLKSE